MVFSCLFLVCFSEGPCFSGNDLKMIGAGFVSSTSPYQGVGQKSMAVPVALWNYKGFYIKGIELGYNFYESGRLKLSLLSAPRFMGYHSDDSTDLNGLEDRLASFDAGLGVNVALPWKDSSLDLRLVNDTLSRYDGREAQLKVVKSFRKQYFEFSPNAGVRLQSGEMTDYYYGVKSSEARPGRAQYSPGPAVNCFAGLMFNTGLSPRWLVVTTFEVESLASEIRRSPIVDRDHLFTAVAAVTRKF
jgi:outer membrane protein